MILMLSYHLLALKAMFASRKAFISFISPMTHISIFASAPITLPSPPGSRKLYGQDKLQKNLLTILL